ncbi:MAG: NAD-dependent epimerase/dehydratase family protein [Candidatus Omnitrophica bacterium]|nr:NAD-dependent epimerase/dehydratase family protein [Candidatus Omnitrophota bacterium]MCG2703403.1 NAD-dependent epimerase/dehydratase family protein [Candidatus Omnitrophota bacterium]MCG2711485.1 NAD-dependent epimerase/dehydratase family protein [Candidatus Omnitrophota bacterium]
MKTILVTGSGGLIGSEAVKFFVERGYQAVGIDNDMRGYFFGPEASTEWNRKNLEVLLKDKYIHYNADIRDNDAIAAIFREHSFELIIHTAAQPSHDWAAKEPFTDFTVNANGTLVLLENFRAFCPEATFIFTSTNKVYGDRPNHLPFLELETRYELPRENPCFNGIDEAMSIDDCLHSLFGASKLAADIMVQEYGKYFGLNTGVFRAGCLSGPGHSATQLHGFLAYLVKCIVTGKKYTVFGYKGKQVRDNMHSFDLVNMFWYFHQKPRRGEVYNAGGARHSNISVLEAITKLEKLLNKKAVYEYNETNRIGDHIWYISDVSKFKAHYPEWDFTYNIDKIMEEICIHGHK